MPRFSHAFALSIVAICMVSTSIAQTVVAPPSAHVTAVSGDWDSFVSGMGEAGKRMMARLPQRLRSDPLMLQAGYRLLLSATPRLAIDANGSDRAHPVFVPESTLP
jgi:hypothetical protein